MMIQKSTLLTFQFMSKLKLIVNKRSNLKKFEMFIDKLYQSGIHELKIVDMFDISDVSSDDEDVEKSEDTLTILNEYVDLLVMSMISLRLRI